MARENDEPDSNDSAPERADAADPVKQYYRDKKRRYLKDAKQASRAMKTGTPFDWEDAERYRSSGAADEED